MKNYQKLSREEMKHVLGGDVPPPTLAGTDPCAGVEGNSFVCCFWSGEHTTINKTCSPARAECQNSGGYKMTNSTSQC